MPDSPETRTRRRRVELIALGRVDLRAGARPIPSVLAQPKRLGLLAYLAMARPRGPQSREALLATFWPELPEQRARHALSQSLYFLERQLGAEIIERSGLVRVGISDALETDVGRFEQLLGDGRFEEALALYQGDLLPDLHIRGCPGFGHWLERERYRLHRLAVEAASSLAGSAKAAGDRRSAVRWRRWAVQRDPCDDGAAENLLVALGEAGDPVGVRLELDRFETRVRQELGFAPPRRIRETAEAALEVAAGAEPLQGTPAALEPNPSGSDAGPAEAARRLSVRSLGSLVAAGVVAVTAVLVLNLRPTSSRADAPDRVYVAPPQVSTSDPDLERLARITADWVAREVASSGVAEVVAPSVVGSVDSDGSVSRGSGADPLALARDVDGVGLLVSGILQQDGERLTFDMTLIDVPTGRVRARVPTVSAPGSRAGPAMAELSRRVTGSLAAVLDRRLGRWSEISSQPPSLAAYNTFLDGLDAYAAGEHGRADSAFFRAAAMDAEFTAPLVWAVRSRIDANRIESADSLARMLEARRDELAPWDRAMLDYQLAYLHGSWEEAYLAALRVEDLAPDPDWMILLASAAGAANRPGEALEILSRLDHDTVFVRDWPWRWRTWAIAYHRAGEYELELAAARPHGGDSPLAVVQTELGAYAALGRLGDFDRALEQYSSLVRDPRDRVGGLRNAVAELRSHGHPTAAQELAERSVHLADSLTTRPDAGPSDQYVLGLALYDAGRWDAAYDVLTRLDVVTGLPQETLDQARGLAAARLGRESEARSIIARLARPRPLGKGHTTHMAAKVLAALGDEAAATEMLRRAFDEGFGYYPWLHTVAEFQELAGYPPFDDLMRPKG